MKATIKIICMFTFALLALPKLLGADNHSGYPSDVLSYYSDWKITLGDGSTVTDLIDYENEDYFFNTNDSIDWVVYKTPNSGGTTPNSSNTRSELRQYSEWTPEKGGKLSGNLKIMHVSTTGDARVPATFSVVVGQIHSDEDHKNEPIKIFYKKFPGHTKGSVFWNYEINTEGDNGERWDYSTAVWGNDWSVVGADSANYPAEPEEGITLGEEFSYIINVYEGVMHLTFESEGHPTMTFSKSLIASEYIEYDDIPQQVLTVFSSTGQDGTEQATAYSGESQYFKQGAYNQTNGKAPADNMVWNTGAETYGGNLADQYANGSYAEVWFREASVGEGTEPEISQLQDQSANSLSLYPNPATTHINITSTNQSITSIKVYNLQGECVSTVAQIKGSHSQLDLSNIEPNIYFIETENTLREKSIHRIVKR